MKIEFYIDDLVRSTGASIDALPSITISLYYKFVTKIVLYVINFIVCVSPYIKQLYIRVKHIVKLTLDIFRELMIVS